MKLNTNEERLAHAESLCLQGRRDQAERLVFEWVKTGVFTLHHFSLFVGFCLRASPV